mmetsp:Transcript_7213/g.22292  ORF Transcript_7213/g.22292 Transcript_7213/m.22292 type:complete len:205 (+) Transcript_7213:447-1061(+)
MDPPSSPRTRGVSTADCGVAGGFTLAGGATFQDEGGSSLIAGFDMGAFDAKGLALIGLASRTERVDAADAAAAGCALVMEIPPPKRPFFFLPPPIPKGLTADFLLRPISARRSARLVATSRRAVRPRWCACSSVAAFFCCRRASAALRLTFAGGLVSAACSARTCALACIRSRRASSSCARPISANNSASLASTDSGGSNPSAS